MMTAPAVRASFSKLQSPIFPAKLARIGALVLALGASALAQKPSIAFAPFVEGLDRPLALADAGGGRIFIVEQPGVIRVVDNGNLDRRPWLDLKDRVEYGDECGLLGLALHPDFARNGRFFVNYTTKKRGKLETVVEEFRTPSRSSRPDPASARELLRFEQPWRNHNGGCLAFGPDGHLYIGVGDGGSAGDPRDVSQKLDQILGKLLRINVDGARPYAIPADNPFAKTAGARGEIWAFGLRNPWRFSFDRKTGDLWAGDVGQNKFEEIDRIRRGGNYGWSAREGMHPFKPERAVGESIEPVKEYPRKLGVSVTGGYVYRGREIPDLQGSYLYADYITGRIWGLKMEGEKVIFDEEIAATKFRISSFGEDAGGELYVCDFNGGNVWKIVPGS